ncbi:hypothetical protein AUF16_05035 [Enterococcus avium]|nr:hypothetical protein AUF16_05035 [Enterococcus avium]
MLIVLRAKSFNYGGSRKKSKVIFALGLKIDKWREQKQFFRNKPNRMEGFLFTNNKQHDNSILLYYL